MKKLLILTYDFPPYVSVGGLRPYNWYKYLKEFGVEPIVVTRQWSNKHGNGLDYIEASDSRETIVEETEYGTLIRAPYFPTWSNRMLLKYGENRFRFLRKALTAFIEFRQFIYPSGPKSTLYFAAKSYLKENKVDAIIATGDPFVLFSFANRLSKEFKTPWIADYRDPWTQKKGRKSNALERRFHPWMEKRTMKSVTAITTVSDFFKKKIAPLVPLQIPFYIFPNGYDPEVIGKVAQQPQNTDKLTICLVGTIYDWHPWKSFLEVFLSLEKEHPNQLQVNFYGINIQEEMEEFLSNYPEEQRQSVQIFPRMPNATLLQKIAQENVMLLFNDFSIIGTKIFDYLGIKRKIILCYANDEKALQLKEQHYNIEEEEGMSQTLQADLIQATNSGIVVENEVHLKNVLLELVHEFQAKGKIECLSVDTENYSRKIQVKKLAELLSSSILSAETKHSE